MRSRSAPATRTSWSARGAAISPGHCALLVRRTDTQEVDMKQLWIALPVVALALGGSTACATKKFVRTSVGEVNEKVEGVTKSVEETQQRIAKNEESIGQ